MKVTLQTFLDTQYGPDGDVLLAKRLNEETDLNTLVGGETPLHVATRRHRTRAVELLITHGADLNAKNEHGKTAYAHAVRRGFTAVAKMLEEAGADTTLNAADRLAVALTSGALEDAKRLLEKHPASVHTGNPEEDRLLADLAGRNALAPVVLLLEAGADLTAPGLDTGTPLHQAAWFGQPETARLLIDAGAPLDVFDEVHESSPLGWAVHGCRYAGGASDRQEVYVELVHLLLDAGSSLRYPDATTGQAYLERLRKDATLTIKRVLPEAL